MNMLKKTLPYLLFYAALSLLVGLVFYFYSYYRLRIIIAGSLIIWGTAIVIHLIIGYFLQGKKRAKPVNNPTPQPTKKSESVDMVSAKPTLATVKHDIQHAPSSFVSAKAYSKPVNAMREVLQSAFENNWVKQFSQLSIYGHSIVHWEGQREIGYYCQVFVHHRDSKATELSSLALTTDKNTIVGDVDILSLYALCLEWQKITNNHFNIPYYFFPLSKRSLEEKGFVKELKGFLKAQKMMGPAMTRVYNRLVFVLPFSNHQEDYHDDCLALTHEGMKLAILFQGNNNPLLEDDLSYLIRQLSRQGAEFFLLSATDLEEAIKQVGVQRVLEQINELRKARVLLMVFNVHNEETLEKVMKDGALGQQQAVELMMGKLFDKQVLLTHLPLIQ